MNSKLGRWTLAILAHIALIVAWYLFVRIGNVPRFVMPSPGATLDAFLQPNYDWWVAICSRSSQAWRLRSPSAGRRRWKRSSCRCSCRST